jgi:hypothetical protein
MYTFATAAMLGLGVLIVATLVERYAIRTERPEIWGVLLIGLGVGAAWLASFNIWDQWRLAVRWDWVGVTLTGLMLAGLAQVWHATLDLLAGVGRKYSDEAAVLEKAEGLRRIA